MPGPSKKVQGGYLGYSALTDSYWNTLNNVRKGQTQRLEQEKLEIANEDALLEDFTLPGSQTAGPQTASRTRGGVAPTVVTNSGFSYTANVNDPALMGLITPEDNALLTPEEQARNAYRERVSSGQKDLFKETDFTLDGSTLQQGGGFNSALQNALEGLKGSYVKAGRKTSPRKRREQRLAIKGQLGALQAFSGEVQGLQQSYKQAYDNGLISYGTKSEFIDFLNTVSGPNDLQVEWKDGRGFLMGTSRAGEPISLPLDNLEALKNGLVLKQNNPAPVVEKLVQQVNKLKEGVDERGVKFQNNDWTEETTNQVQNQLSQLLPDSNAVLSMGIDWLGFNGTEWKSRVANDPEGSKQIVLDALSAHVKTQHTPTAKGGLTEDQYADNQLQGQKFDETKRHNRVTEGQAQQRINKPTGKPDTKEPTQEDALFMQRLTEEVNFITPGKGEKDVVLSGLVGGKIKKAAYRKPTKDTKDQFPNGHYEVEVAGGGTNLIDVSDKLLLMRYVAEAQGINPELVRLYTDAEATQSNSTQSSKAADLRKKYDY